ncbi:MAG TPA: TonB-dependent receptor [Bryobacteraceae bacterium]|jgi:hypothetical protein|nr:TonB-dependent receptor [Bryobacteraceae bacterium]
MIPGSLLKRPLVRLLAVALLASALLLAQVNGALVGTVRDSAGGAIADARVTATNRDTGIVHSQITDDSGNFLFSNLPVGVYTISFAADRFQPLRVDNVGIHVASTIRQDAKLSVAQLNSTVEVTSSTPLVKSETSEIGQLVDSRQITQLPLNGRDVYSLLQLTAGTETQVSPAARFTSLERPTVAGGRAGYTVFRINGININTENLPSASITPNVDSVQEFRAIVAMSPASETSSSSVDVVTRAGTGEFHGTLYNFFRNNVLDVHPFFERDIVAPGFTPMSDQLRYNQFGGSFGGPIRKNRTFFFAGIESTRDHTTSQVTETYPTAQMLAGNFSGVNPLSGSALNNFGAVNDPATGKPFPGNLIPVSRDSTFAHAFSQVGFLPANCLACQADGLGFNFVGEEGGVNDRDQYLGRIDHHAGDRDSLFGSFEIESAVATSTESPIPISVMNTPTRGYGVQLNETHIFSPGLLNEFRAGYTRLRETLEQKQNASGAFTFQNTPTSLPSLYPTLILPGYSSFGNGAASDRNFGLEVSYDINDNVTWVRGAHEVKAGFEGMRARFSNIVNLNAVFAYEDGLPVSLGFSGVGFADFLLGVPFLGETFQGTGKANTVERNIYGGYIQDNWKASPRLTLNLGLRWEYFQRWHDSNTSLNRIGTLDTSAASRALGGRFILGNSPNYYIPGEGLIQSSGPPLIRGSIVDPDWHDFQPRVGFAWRPFGGNRTAIRGGAGIYYMAQDANSIAFELLSPPFSYAAVTTNLPPAVPLGSPLRDSQFFPATGPAGAGSEGDAPGNRDPHMYQWSFDIQHQAGNDILLAAEYLGNRGVDNPISVAINQPDLPNAQQLAVLELNPALNSTLALARPKFPNIPLDYEYVENIAPSWYQGLNLKAIGRFGSRLQYSAVYTWSKALDWASAEQQIPVDTANLRLSKSYSDYDHPNRFVGSWVYDIPIPAAWASHPLLRQISAGWELTGIVTVEAGPPYSITMGVDPSFTGAASASYPDLIGPPVYDDIRASNGHYLAETNFTAAPFGEFGTLARNALHGPGIANVDLGVLKNFSFSERLHLQLRGEFFNAFNHAQFAFAGSSLATSISTPSAIAYTSASNFGRVAADPPRIIQVAAKVLW